MLPVPATGHTEGFMRRSVVGHDRITRTNGMARIAAGFTLLCVAVVTAASLGSAPAGAATQPAVEASSDAAQAAVADPRVAAALAGTDYTVAGRTWGEGDSAGTTVVFTWKTEDARSVAATWPLLKTVRTGVPAPPFETAEHHLRIGDLTALRVDVLKQGRVLQILPLAGETQYRLFEETWPPFSWIPWFTSRPWVLAPVFIIAALVIVVRAWRRSRTWNRRLPSMTRHDRQFIGRLSFILFLLAGLAWQVYEAVYAAKSPSVVLGGFDAGDLTALPILLFPPALFVAALILEFGYGAHRVAWGLVSALAAAGCIYNLATAMISTTGNLNLSYYILLGALALLTAPRAFSAGRMGWSRHGMPRYT
jgi:hypothetical protein